jgi:Smg protein
MIDILVYLFANYHDFRAYPKARTLKRKLSALGFKEEAIRVALGWLDGLKTAEVADWPGSRRALRVYVAEEQLKLGVRCLGFIAFLEASDLITPALRELVIERAMILEDTPVPLAKFKIIVLMVLWSREQNLEPLVVEELLDDGNLRLLH